MCPQEVGFPAAYCKRGAIDGQNLRHDLLGATLINHDGETRRDLGLSGGKIAEIGHLSQASAGERIDCTGLQFFPASSTRKCISASPAHSQGRSGDRFARSRAWRRDGGVRNAEHQAADDDVADIADKVGRAKRECTATSHSGLAARMKTRRIFRSWSASRARPG